MKLEIAKKIEIKMSPDKGMGVFAVEPIKLGEVIEECHIVKLPTKKWENSTLLFDYRFCYPQGPNWSEYVIPLGYGCVYNHDKDNNAHWRNHPKFRGFQFFAVRDIDWIEKYFGQIFYKKITMTHSKDLVIGDYLIDDRLANGAKDFNGELIRFGWDYENENWNEYPGWNNVLEKLLD